MIKEPKGKAGLVQLLLSPLAPAWRSGTALLLPSV